MKTKRSGATDIDLREFCDCCEEYIDDNDHNEFIHTERRKKNMFVCSKCASEIEMDTNQFWRRVS